jgi:nucleotide-binding universal stress UspA family protein
MGSTDHFIIVAGIDFSEGADCALDRALVEAARRGGSEVHVVYVERDSRPGSARARREMGADATVDRVQQRICQRMHRMPADLDKQRILRVVAHYRHGSPAEGIAQLAADLGAELIVVGFHDRGGLVAEGVVRLASCRVMVAHDDASVTGDQPWIKVPCAEHPLREHHHQCASNGVYAAEMTVYGPD